jgi:hypothetical protein
MLNERRDSEDRNKEGRNGKRKDRRMKETYK